MKTNSFAKWAAAAVFLLAAGLFIALPASADAKTSNKLLEVNKTYHQYDVTGDKKADTLLISSPWDEEYQMHHGCSVFINGKKVLSRGSSSSFYAYSIEVRRLQLDNGKVYLAIIPTVDNGDIPGAAIYQYKGGKLKKAIDLNSMSKIGYHNSVSKIVVSKNKIGVTYSEMSHSLGYISFRLDYQYKKGAMVQTTTKPKLLETGLKFQNKSYWTANRKMNVLKSPGGKKLTVLKPGRKVKIDRLYLNTKHNRIYLHVKIKGGKSGWIKGLTKYPGEDAVLFKEVIYAG